MCTHHYFAAYTAGIHQEHAGVVHAKEKPCKFVGCGGAGTRRGMCSKHYNRERTAGRLASHPTHSPGATDVVPAGPVRAHLVELIEGGLPPGRIAMLTGVNLNTIIGLLGAKKRGGVPVRVTARSSATRIGLLRLTTEHLPSRTPTLALGARRRLRALLASGWAVDEIAARLGVAAVAVEAILSPELEAINVATHRKVHSLYRQLAMAPPPVPDQASLDRAHAGRWPTAICWANIDLDAERYASIPQAA